MSLKPELLVNNNISFGSLGKTPIYYRDSIGFYITIPVGEPLGLASEDEEGIMLSAPKMQDLKDKYELFLIGCNTRKKISIPVMLRVDGRLKKALFKGVHMGNSKWRFQLLESKAYIQEREVIFFRMNDTEAIEECLTVEREEGDLAEKRTELLDKRRTLERKAITLPRVGWGSMDLNDAIVKEKQALDLILQGEQATLL